MNHQCRRSSARSARYAKHEIDTVPEGQDVRGRDPGFDTNHIGAGERPIIVLDRCLSGLASEHIDIAAPAPVQRISPGPGVEDVVTVIARQPVVPGASHYGVIAILSANLVVAGAAFQPVVARSTTQLVVICPAHQVIVAIFPVEHVRAGVSVERVAIGATGEGIVPAPPEGLRLV